MFGIYEAPESGKLLQHFKSEIVKDDALYPLKVMEIFKDGSGRESITHDTNRADAFELMHTKAKEDTLNGKRWQYYQDLASLTFVFVHLG